MRYKIYNSSNNPLKYFYQWDVGQIIKMEIADINDPIFHFSNRKSSTALVVTPTVDEDFFIAAVPNILLQQAETLDVYVYGDDNLSGARTMYQFSIGVRPRPKPDDYVYEENIEYLSVALLNARLSEMGRYLSNDDAQTSVEVADIRVKTDGTICNIAGDAVRANEEMILNLSQEVDTLSNDIKDYIDNKAADGLYYNDDTFQLSLALNGEPMGDPVVIIKGSLSPTLVVDTLPGTPNANVNYVLKTSDGYLFYKYINDQWRLVSGSLMVIVNNLPATGNAYTDYYVKAAENRYAHYRWINGSFVEIGSSAEMYTKAQIDTQIGQLNSQLTNHSQSLTALNTSVDGLGGTTEALDTRITNLQQAVSGIQIPSYRSEIVYEEDTETYNLILYQVLNGEETPISADVIPFDEGGSNTLVVESLPDDPDPEADYILNISNGCLYYKYIDNEWKLIGGSLAVIGDELPDTGNSFTDYYIEVSSNKFAHYRWIDDEFVQIGTSDDTYTKAQIDAQIGQLNSNLTTQTQAVAGLNNTVTSIQQTIADMDTEGATYRSEITYDEETEKYFLILYETVNEVETIVSSNMLPATGGGGGGGGSTTTLTVNKITDSPLIITPTDKAIIEVNVSAHDEDDEAIDATYTWKVGSTVIMSGLCLQGVNTFDLTEYVSVGTQKLTLTVTDEGGNVSVKSWTVQVVDVRMTSSFADQYTNPINTSVAFTYTPYGAVSKTVHFKLDGTELDSVITSASGTLQSYSIPAQSHGTHLLETWITATVGGVTIETPHIFKDIIWYDEESLDPVISCIYRNDYYGTIQARQYDSLSIDYVVYDPSTSSPTVTLTVDGAVVSTLHLSQAKNTWMYKLDTVGSHTLQITCKDVTVTIDIEVDELGIDVSPVTGNLIFDFNPSGYSNASANRLWQESTNSSIALTVSDNFDWDTGGYQIDSDGSQYFCVKAGTRAYISYNLFGTDPKQAGESFKIIYKATNVSTADTTFLSCQNNTESSPVGLTMKPHENFVKTSADSLRYPASEEDRIEFEYVIEPLDLEDDSATSLIMTYEDGVSNRPLIYDSSARLHQLYPVPITIGSDDCDVYIYRMKAYGSFLTSSDIRKNFIADALTSDEMISRYDRNQIYDENSNVTPESVAASCPDLKILKLEAPHFTNNKSDFVLNSTLTCIHRNGDPVLDNWTWRNGAHAGQGTTSNEYGAAARNLVFIYNFDGEHQANSKIPLDTTYKSELVMGDGTKYQNGTGSITLSRTSAPTKQLNAKVNVASSEMTNNALLAKRYEDYLPWTTPAAKRDSRVKCGMEFYNAVIFIKESDPDLTTHREFSDTEWHFYSLANIGDSKNTDRDRAYDPEDINEFCVEISDNTLPNSTFSSGVYDESGKMVYPITADQWTTGNEKYDALYNNWDDSFEFRYVYCAGQKVSEISKSTIQAQGKQIFRDMYGFLVTSTDDDFKAHFDDWFVRESAFYFYLFTHHHSLTDNRAKNVFPHWGKIYISESDAAVMTPEEAACYTIDNDAAAVNNGYRFDFWQYDFDTGLGINNSGELTFPSGKEDIDYRTDGDVNSGYVFNGAESVLWGRIRDLFVSELREMYQTVNANCWSAEHLISEFDVWQEQFPEVLWDLHYERLYRRTYNNGTPRYMSSMAQGRKKYHRRQWIREQQPYFGTKYLHSSVKADQIMFRCNTPQQAVVPPNYNLTIVPYSDMYISVLYGNSPTVTQVRAKAGQTYEITTSLDSMDETAVLIYAAGQIQSLNDLSGCYIHDNDFSKATRIKNLTIGSNVSGYDNPFLVNLNMGDNKLLESLDIRNCSNLTGSLNLSACPNLRTLRAENTALTSVTFANAGKIQAAYIPSTINTISMRNLKYLTTLSIPSWSNLEQLICEYSNIDSLSIMQAATSLQIARVLGIDWTVANTDLLNTTARMPSSLLTGSVYVSGYIGMSELAIYEAKWPDLTVTYNSEYLVVQHKATYVDADGNILYTTFIDQGQAPIDPVALNYISTPTKEADAQYIYTFSGWDDITTSMITERTITALFTTSIRSYPVRYWLKAGSLISETEANYGTEVVPPDSPDDTTGEAMLMYSVFKGWSNSTGCIRGAVDSYAVFETASKPTIGSKALNEMSMAEIYGVFKSGEQDSYFSDGAWFEFELGHDLNFDNVPSQVLATEFTLDGSNYIDTGIQLFNKPEGAERAFTIAIDYEFTDTEPDNTLISCFGLDETRGFRLRYSGGPNIQWGEQSQSVGAKDQRNMTVIRYPGSGNILYIYTYNTQTSNWNDTTSIMEPTLYRLLRTLKPDTSANLIIGAHKYIDVMEDPGHGVIHWAKIWHDDLGPDNCKKLAWWPHTKQRASFATGKRYRVSGSSAYAGSFLLDSLLPLPKRHQPTATNTGGYAASEINTFLETRVYKAFPEELRAMIPKVRVVSTDGDMKSSTTVTNVHLYLPAYSEVQTTTQSPYTDEATACYPWFTNNANRLRWYDLYPPIGGNVTTSNTDPSLLDTVNEGDIWINTNNNSRGYFYHNGKWVMSTDWWTRSPYVSNSTSFWYVHYSGVVGNSGAANTIGILAGFSIRNRG